MSLEAEVSTTNMSASCPLCDLPLPLSELEWHANSHFEDDEDEQIAYDRQLALQIASSSSYSSTTLDDYINGSIGSLDFNEKVSSLGALQTKSCFYHVRDGGVVSLLRLCLESESKSKSRECTVSLLSGYVDHYECVPSEDVGWGCGWRNIQMLCSHLISHREEAGLVLFGGCRFVPDIPSLQRWLEIAWERGFDPPGSLHFSHKIYGSTKWIGTTECAALLRSFGIQARIVDFGPKESRSLFLSVPGSALAPKSKPYGPMDRYLLPERHSQQESSVDRSSCSTSSVNVQNGSKRKINREEIVADWIWNYFSDKSLALSGAVSSSVVLTNKAPLYFQHDGHSRTIAGIQKHHRGFMHQYTLLILDPAHRSAALERSLRENVGWQKYLKRGVHTLKESQYQLCYIDSGIAVGKEVEQLKTVHSVFIEV